MNNNDLNNELTPPLDLIVQITEENVMTPTNKRWREFIYMMKVLSEREYKGKETLRERALKEMGLNLS